MTPKILLICLETLSAPKVKLMLCTSISKRVFGMPFAGWNNPFQHFNTSVDFNPFWMYSTIQNFGKIWSFIRKPCHKITFFPGVDKHLGVVLSCGHLFFAKICCKFLAFFRFFAAKALKMTILTSVLECAEPKRWSKYTTLVVALLVESTYKTPYL